MDKTLFADAEIFATPDPDSSQEYKHHYAKTLTGLQTLLQQNLLSLAFSEETYAALWSNAKYPNRANLQRVFSGDPIYVSCDKLADLVSGYMNQATWLESELSVGEPKAGEITCDPPEYLDLQLPEFKTASEGFIGLILLYGSRAQKPGKVNPTMLSGVKLQSIDGAIPEALEMDVSSTLLFKDVGGGGDISAERDDLVEKLLEGKVYTIFSISEYHHTRDPVMLWMDSQTEDGIRESVVTYLAQNLDEESETRLNYRFASSFLDNLSKPGFKRDSTKVKKLLRGIRETICSLNLDQTHVLRINSHPRSRQRMRKFDNAGAMRRDVDRDCHIHYWNTGGGVIEFARVTSTHDDMAIPE